MSISVIVPTLNEAACLPATLLALRAQHPLEILVVDGGSIDGTLERAGDARCLGGVRGRAAQMNLGAAHARGEILLFLHADCIPGPGALAALQTALRQPRLAAACFSMRVAAPGLVFRAVERCAAARVRLTGLAYGDQGLGIRKSLFQQVGGFPTLRFMEDVFLARALRRFGRIAVLPQTLTVAARRWQRVGPVRQTLRNWSLTALALAGIAPDRLARFYPDVR